MGTPAIEPALIEAARRGDPPSLDRLLVACGPGLRRYAARHCVAADVDDAVQESMLILARRLPALRAPGAFFAWVFRVVRRECLRLLGKGRRGHVPIDRVDEGRHPRARDDVELRLVLREALGSLPDPYREVVILRDFEELTIREISGRLGLPAGTVKTRIRRGRARIRAHLLA